MIEDDKKKICVHVNEAHELLGHAGGEDRIRCTIKALGMELKRGRMYKCEPCAIGKAKQKSIPRATDLSNESKATIAGGRMNLDLTSLKNPKNTDPNDKSKFILRNQMRLLHDEYSEMRFVRWHATKDDMVIPVCELFAECRSKGKIIQRLRMDGAGENQLLEKTLNSSDWKEYPDIEYTARNTPQQNGQAEVAIFAFANRCRSLMAAANVLSC